MSERKIMPIIFSGPMVQTLLAGRKTQTRRLEFSPLAKAEPGDLLWVREAWGTGTRPCPVEGWRDGIEYKADLHVHDELPLVSEGIPENVDLSQYRHGWHPSIHMPRWASRLTLEVVEKRFERLQEISKGDAACEGLGVLNTAQSRVYEPWISDPLEEFAYLWNSLHAKPGETWDDNPGIVALTFKVYQVNVDERREAA